MGIIGTSLGSLITAVSLAYELRLLSAALIVVGSDLAEINTKSDEKSLAALRETRMNEYGINSISEYQILLTSQIHYDPLVTIPKSSVHTVYMMIGTKDLTVPTANQLKLLDVVSKKADAEAHYFPGNHFETITIFFDRHLK